MTLLILGGIVIIGIVFLAFISRSPFSDPDAIPEGAKEFAATKRAMREAREAKR